MRDSQQQKEISIKFGDDEEFVLRKKDQGHSVDDTLKNSNVKKKKVKIYTNEEEEEASAKHFHED